MKGNSKKNIFLISGLPIQRKNSFSRQLDLLGRGLEERGWRAVLIGRSHETQDTALSSGPRPLNLDFPVLSPDTVEELAEEHQPTAAILLGYPDQFPFLERQWSFPLFLWAQFSSPPDHPYLASVVSVPLTEITRIYLLNAAHARLGPVIPHAVDTDVFRPSPDRSLRSSPRDRFVVGSVGANSPRKRFDILFHVFRLFSSRHPESRLLVKTDRGAKAGGYDLHRLAAENDVVSKVRIIDDDLPPEEMASLFRSMDVYLHTAEWEGFGLPPLEAMSCGVPVITPPIQGPGEIIPYTDWIVWDSRVVRDGKTVLRWADPKAVASLLDHACRHPRTRRAIGQLGRRTATAEYDYRVITSLWEKMLI